MPDRGRTKNKARARTTPYTAEQRAEALDVARSRGLAEAHRVTGVSKQTLSRWCKAAGVDLADVAASRTEAATAARMARHAEVKASTVEALEHNIEQALAFLNVVLGTNAAAAQSIAVLDPDRIKLHPILNGAGTVTGYTATVDDDVAGAQVKAATALNGLGLTVKSAVGALTRGIHDLQLLNGEATERGTVVVEFDIPRPTEPAGPVPEYPENPEG